MIEHRPITSRAEWLDWRQSYLTASDVPAVAGVDPYKGALRVFAEKTGTVPDLIETSVMRRGRHFESAALDYLGEENPNWRIWRPNLFITDDECRLACTPDAFAEDADDPGKLINCQIKTVNRPTFESWDGTPPLGYRLQVHCENYLAGADRGLLVVLVVSTYDAFLATFDVPRRRDVEATIRDIARLFWFDIAAGRRPPPDFARDGDIIRALLEPVPTDPPLDLTTDNRIRELLDTRTQLMAAIKKATADKKAIDTEIITKLNGADTAVADGWRITWREQTTAAYSVPEKTGRKLDIRQTKERDAA